MASIGHIAIGIAAARVEQHDERPGWRSMMLWSALSMLPDVDVIGFTFGVRYADEWGHRGATHSLAMAVALGAAIGLAAPAFRRPVVRTAAVAIAVLASHGLLDTMTDGGLGCALRWPFDRTRYFAPWRPIPVAPIGLAFLSGGGVVALTELVLFSPAMLFALRPRPFQLNRAAVVFLFGVWIASVWLISSTDPFRQSLIGFIVREDTAYASGFSERAFRDITLGQSKEDVRRLVGAPIGESWFYTPKNLAAADMSVEAVRQSCLSVRFERGTVVALFDEQTCRQRGIRTGMPPADVERVIGKPTESCWRYTWSPGSRPYRMRMVCFMDARVESVARRWN
jgi:inner membrane protein